MVIMVLEVSRKNKSLFVFTDPRNGGGQFSKNHEKNDIKTPRNNVQKPNVLGVVLLTTDC